MSFLAVLKLLVLASVVLNVMAMAMRSKPQDVLYLFRHWREGVGAFVAMFVVVPAVALVLMLNFQLKPELKIALLVLSLSPVPSLLPRRQAKTGAENPYITGLLVAAALASLVVMPLGLHLAGLLFGIEMRATAGGVAMNLLLTIGAPMALGFLALYLLRERAHAVSLLLRKAGMLLLMVCAAVLLVVMAPDMWRLVGGGTLAALMAMILCGLGAGYFLGGSLPENRAALALASATRHPGVALSVIGTAFPGQHLALVAVLLAVLLNLLVAVPFLRLVRRQAAAS